MLDKFYPDFRAESVLTADFAKLYDRGVRFIVFDADNTLVSYEETEPSERIIEFVRGLTRAGFGMCILSNGHKERVKKLAAILGMSFEGDAFKPSRKGFRRVFAQYGVTGSETLVVGDQIFTDVWGASRSSCLSLLVKPISPKKEPPFVRLKRIPEKLFLRKIEEISECIDVPRGQ
ncbi:MAG: YqeG family HAD IIIA-type phosphatase [Clostridia bacterium]|jgi:HAD superfamily phosphatase (TIGR01668 family)|nr:YqeG family HAD IIIA-type phosphatase [Clostridia bacterium]MBO7659729.1 YqeG family HAD IIIA-type phosphatase [Clostridia bacterium]MBP5664712.1 YqeG family HAD IIIA-type phosphatase [Clostridia bacterium]MBP5767265.1 YqeG family HAD IIIA-type phosphatase [Clostridia bacterium]MBR5006523.1 YqeG family HAD IIIA-type phosphatase [Clostridia bacterium]